MKKILYTLLLIVAIIVLIYAWLYATGREKIIVTSPTPTETTGKENFIRVTSLKANDTITSPLTVTGVARTWFLEGSFPVMLTDWDGKIIAQGIAQAQGEPGAWMTDNFVPFSATITFTKPA